jgi:hypothetical protein
MNSLVGLAEKCPVSEIASYIGFEDDEWARDRDGHKKVPDRDKWL